MQGLSLSRLQCLLLRYPAIPWRLSRVAHPQRCIAIPRWPHGLYNRVRRKNHTPQVASHHRPSSMHLSLQGVVSPHAPRWPDRRRASRKDDTCPRFLSPLHARRLRLPRCRESTAHATGTTTASRYIPTPLLVRSQVHQENPLLASKPATHHARTGTQFTPTVRQSL